MRNVQYKEIYADMLKYLGRASWLRLFLFFTAAIVYLELLYRLWNFNRMSADFIFAVLFAIPAAALLFVITGLMPEKAGHIAACSLMALLTLCYLIQLIYYCIFRTPLSFYSLGGAEDAMQFGDVVFVTVMSNILAVILMLVPLILFFVFGKELGCCRLSANKLRISAMLLIPSFLLPVLCVNLTDRSNASQYTLYYKTYSPELSVNKLGLLTTMRLDVQRLVFGSDLSDNAGGDVSRATTPPGPENTDSYPVFAQRNAAEPSDAQTQAQTEVGPLTEHNSSGGRSAVSGISTAVGYNTMDIDFDSLIAGEKNETLLGMHKYFSSVEPTRKNEYTGLYKGYNLIFITAEAFSPYAVDPELTPTLYKMANEGFVFRNFYNPVWGVSTSDGEYVACTGLLPKSGVWSFARSGQNYMPFVMGNQFKKLGYPVRAYHDHTYTYYKRNISHPNMGYDYKGVGNGLQVEKTWPESDLEMINVTAPEYIGQEPFHTYYMTVSGHLQYNFSGNFIARKNRPLVEKLPYSNPAKAYIACNIELDLAMKALIEKLEAAGIADRTVIAISPDHYPYGLQKEVIDELAGHRVEDNFELYKSIFILWKAGMEPVTVDKPCASMDIIPTLSNLFGLEYDSRLLMGSDILSDSPPLVIFSNWSWITDKARYNTVTGKVEFENEKEKNRYAGGDKAYIREINKTVADRYKYSVKILDNDYYNKVIPH